MGKIITLLFNFIRDDDTGDNVEDDSNDSADYDTEDSFDEGAASYIPSDADNGTVGDYGEDDDGGARRDQVVDEDAPTNRLRRSDPSLFQLQSSFFEEIQQLQSVNWELRRQLMLSQQPNPIGVKRNFWERCMTNDFVPRDA